MLTGAVFRELGGERLDRPRSDRLPSMFTRGVGLLGAEFGTNGRFGVSKLFD